METATPQTISAEEKHETALPPGVEPIDPERDIDAKHTILWLGSSMVFVFVCMWVLAQVFGFYVAGERERKIQEAPTEELRLLRSAEDAYLRKVPPAGMADDRSLPEIRASIEATTDRIIAEYVER